MIVSEVPGTTRDSVDVRFERDGKAFIAIDTAGVRKKQQLANDIEFYSMARAERSIRRADVVLLFFDPRCRISQVDKQLAEYILEQHKPAIFVVNKWDLMKAPCRPSKMGDYLRDMFPSLDYVPIAFITAKNGQERAAGAEPRPAAAQAGRARASAPATSTGSSARRSPANPPPMRQNRRAKIYYATQVGTNPPTIVLFTNGPELFDNTYLRYLTKTFRDSFPFSEVAVKLVLRAKGDSAGRGSNHAAAEPVDEGFDLIADADKISGGGGDTEDLLTFADDPQPAKPQPKRPAKHGNRIVPELLEEAVAAPKPKKPKPASGAPPKPKKKRGETKAWDF